MGITIATELCRYAETFHDYRDEHEDCVHVQFTLVVLIECGQ